MSTPVTQQMVADRAGVARATAALILSRHASANRFSEATRQRVFAVAQELNYRPSEIARQLRGEKSSIIGILIGALDAQVNYRCLSMIERLVSERGYRLLIGQLHRDSHLAREYVSDFISRGVNAVICLQHEAPLTDWEQVPKSLALVKHVVYLDKPANLPNAAFIQQDFRAGIAAAVKHVMARGARRVAIITDSLLASCNRRRKDGYCRALKEAGRPIDPALIFDDPLPVQVDAKVVGQLIERLVVKQKADAIIASNDLWAVEIMYAVMDRGYRVPEDVRIVGYDNIDISLACRPQLTTLNPQPERLASLLVDTLFDLIAGKSDNLVIEPQLVVRGST